MPDMEALKNTRLNVNQGNTPYAGDWLYLMPGSPLLYDLSIIAFDIGSLGKVESAILSLYMYASSAGAKSKAVTIQRMLRTDWVEAEATYADYQTGNAWNAAGAAGEGTDYSPTNAVSANTPAADDAWFEADITALWNDAADASQSILSLRLTGSGFDLWNAAYFRARGYATEKPYLTYIAQKKKGRGIIII